MLDYRGYKFTGIIENPYDQKIEEVQTHHHHCQPQTQNQKRQSWHEKMSIKIEKYYLKMKGFDLILNL